MMLLMMCDVAMVFYVLTTVEGEGVRGITIVGRYYFDGDGLSGENRCGKKFIMRVDG